MKPHKQTVAFGTTAVILVMAILLPKLWATEHQKDFGATPTLVEAAPLTTAVQPARPATEPLIPANEILQYANPDQLYLRSGVALVMDEHDGTLLYAKDIDQQRPIASLTKLMTAMVTLDAGLPLDELITVTRQDRDTLRGTHSRLPFGAVVTRYDLLHAALAASENRAAAALARTYPGGTAAFVQAMNAKAQALGMTRTHYEDSSGLNSNDVSTARDLAKLIAATNKYPLFHAWTTTGQFSITDRRNGSPIRYFNTNRLVRRGKWNIELSKTGYTADAGNCIVMETTIGDQPMIIVLLNSWGKLTKFADSDRIRHWLLKTERRIPGVNQTVASAQS
ncbi:MAG: D-alanyl-D-alanine endopeptidase [Acidiferrobacterales bacterium]